MHRFQFQQCSNDLESCLPLYALLESPLLALRASGSIAFVAMLPCWWCSVHCMHVYTAVIWISTFVWARSAAITHCLYKTLCMYADSSTLYYHISNLLLIVPHPKVRRRFSLPDSAAKNLIDPSIKGRRLLSWVLWHRNTTILQTPLCTVLRLAITPIR